MLWDEEPIVESDQDASETAIVASNDLVVLIKHVDPISAEVDDGDAHFHGITRRLTGS
jgi:hypothetical protein